MPAGPGLSLHQESLVRWILEAWAQGNPGVQPAGGDNGPIVGPFPRLKAISLWPPTPFPHSMGFPGAGTAVWPHNSCAVLLEPAAGLIRVGAGPAPSSAIVSLPGGFLLCPLYPKIPSDPLSQPGLARVLGMGCWHKKPGGRTLGSPRLPPHRRGQQRKGYHPKSHCCGSLSVYSQRHPCNPLTLL